MPDILEYPARCARCQAGLCGHDRCLPRDGYAPNGRLATTFVAGTAVCGDCAKPMLVLHMSQPLDSGNPEGWQDPATKTGQRVIPFDDGTLYICEIHGWRRGQPCPALHPAADQPLPESGAGYDSG